MKSGNKRFYSLVLNMIYWDPPLEYWKPALLVLGYAVGAGLVFYGSYQIYKKTASKIRRHDKKDRIDNLKRYPLN